jgi:integrase
VKEVIKEMLAAKRKDRLSESYVRHLGYDLEKFSNAINSIISLITSSEIGEWLRSLDVSPRTRNNLRNSVQTLFSYAKATGYLPKDHDEIESVPLAKSLGGEIEIFTPFEMAELFSCAGPSLIPFLALGAFAGIRHAEIQRMIFADIKLGDGIIQIRAAEAKTASRRTIPILNNLKMWLLPYGEQSGLVCRHRNMADEIVDLVKAVNERRKEMKAQHAFTWKHNALRHSFISYRVAKTQNVAQVALEAGNSPGIIFSNYRELVRPADAEQWFDLTPENQNTYLTQSEKDRLGNKKTGCLPKGDST